MSNDIKRLNSLRSMYKAQSDLSDPSALNELKQIKTELRIINDQKAAEEKVITNATNSPYLTDQSYFNKEVVYNSTEETDWKKVRSYEESKQQAQAFRNLKKLNII